MHIGKQELIIRNIVHKIRLIKVCVPPRLNLKVVHHV
jgi:hypothetical protein